METLRVEVLHNCSHWAQQVGVFGDTASTPPMQMDCGCSKTALQRRSAGRSRWDLGVAWAPQACGLLFCGPTLRPHVRHAWRSNESWGGIGPPLLCVQFRWECILGLKPRIKVTLSCSPQDKPEEVNTLLRQHLGLPLKQA